MKPKAIGTSSAGSASFAPGTNLAAQLAPQATPDTYSFIQLADFIAVIDARKQELYSDKRVRLGAPICRDGDVVTSITLANGWFDVVTASRTYRIPIANVRSAVR